MKKLSEIDGKDKLGDYKKGFGKEDNNNFHSPMDAADIAGITACTEKIVQNHVSKRVLYCKEKTNSTCKSRRTRFSWKKNSCYYS